jgi:LmbE family N-acetylglucosaminyl deacetylase
LRTRRAYKFFLRDWTRLHDIQALALVLSTARFSRNLEPLELPHPRGRRLTVIAPHPDDEILGPGGTLLKAIGAGASVTVLYLTDGKPAERVSAEAKAVAEKFGYHTKFLHLPSNNIPLDQNTVSEFRAAIEALRPDTLFIPFLADDHDDHRRASHLLLQAYGAGSPTLQSEVWGYQVYTLLPPNVVVDISTVAEQKREAIRMFGSQSSRDWAHYMLGMNAFNSRFLRAARGPVFIEAFFVVPGAEYIDLCRNYFSAGDTYYFANYREK